MDLHVNFEDNYWNLEVHSFNINYNVLLEFLFHSISVVVVSWIDVKMSESVLLRQWKGKEKFSAHTLQPVNYIWHKDFGLLLCNCRMVDWWYSLMLFFSFDKTKKGFPTWTLAINRSICTLFIVNSMKAWSLGHNRSFFFDNLICKSLPPANQRIMQIKII